MHIELAMWLRSGGSNCIGINESASFPYDFSSFETDAAPFRLASELVPRLRDAGFRGEILIAGYVGSFCYRARPGLQKLDTPKKRSECTEGGHSREYAIGLGERQAQSIRRILLRQLKDTDGIEINTVSYGMERPRYCYPPDDVTESAVEVNTIARLNNRVEIRLIPESVHEPQPVERCVKYSPPRDEDGGSESLPAAAITVQ